MKKVRKEVIDELVKLRTMARITAESFTESVANQAVIAKIGKGALRRYVCAKEADNIAKLDSEASDIVELLEEDE